MEIVVVPGNLWVVWCGQCVEVGVVEDGVKGSLGGVHVGL